MRILFALSFVLFFVTSSIGQSFTMSELIKMSKMDTDSFDTYVSSKGYVFIGTEDNVNNKGVNYAFKYNSTRLKANKFITLYSYYEGFKRLLNYETLSNVEYVNIKKQIISLGFKLINSSPFTNKNGETSNHFMYKKGKEEISIFTSFESYEINYSVRY